jgi:hypothetical protein
VPFAGGALAAAELAAGAVTAGVLAAGADGADALVVAAGAGADELGDDAVLVELEHPTKATDKSAEVPMVSRVLVMPNRDRCMEFLSSTPARRRLWSDDPGESFGIGNRRSVSTRVCRCGGCCDRAVCVVPI